MTQLITPTTSDEPIWSVWMSAFHAPALAIADGLGLFAALRDAPATAHELATALGIERRAAETIAGLMAGLGFLAQAVGQFHLTDTARHYLLPDSPFYWGPMLRRIRDNPLDCRRLIESLRRGTADADARVTGMWEVPQPPREALRAFTHAMHAHSFALAMRVVPALGLGEASRLLDVAGGSGSFAIAAAYHHPGLHATVLDLPAVCEVAAAYVAEHAVADRIAMCPSDMFVDAWPRGFDRVLLSDIFHDWDDARCRWLAARAHESLVEGGELVIHEMVLSDAKDGPLLALSYSMVMLFVARGRQRSVAEISDILISAGFRDVRVTLTSGGYAAIRGVKAAG